MRDDSLEDYGIMVERSRKIPAVPLEAFRRILLIGLGGIGTALISPLCRYLVYSGVGDSVPVVLVDGDDFEARNRERQDFNGSGNKARVKAAEMRQAFPELSVRSIPEFITPENVGFYVEEGSLVFLAVDNHATRRLLSRHCQDLRCVALVSGGNEWSDGNVQIYLRWEGQEHTSPLTRFHPEIENATDLAAVLSCDEAARAGEPQLLFTNLTVAAHMLNTFYAVINGGLSYEELYFDIISGKSVSVDRHQ